MDEASEYRPMMPDERVQQLRQWHDEAARQSRLDTIETAVLGRRFEVPADVFDPKPVGLWQSILYEVHETDRVLDLGTGSGVNGVLAATKSHDVVAVDVNPSAVEAARRNAELNDVSTRIQFAVSDLFQEVEGRFDLILFDPPFRWFKPADMRGRSTADENYRTLTAFFGEVADRLTPDGRILLFFGTSGDIDYVHHLIERSGYSRTVINHSEHTKDGIPVEYFTYRLVRAQP